MKRVDLMSDKPSTIKKLASDLLGGIVIGALVGVAALFRKLAGGLSSVQRVQDREAEPAATADQELTGLIGSGTALGEASAPLPAPELRPGWQLVEREPLPRPTYWPAALAFGITLLAWGILTSWIISIAGGIVLAVALAGWIGELRHGH
jgi:hypothetical protein